MLQQPLEYQTPTAKRGGSWYGLALGGAALGFLVTVPAFVLAIISGGAGHGDYACARAFFPLPMLLTLITGNTITLVSIVLAFTQFSIYGAVIGRCCDVSRKAILVAIASILLVHLLAAIACFSGAIPNFS